ncbi:hypothetical protein [Thermococcus peptonophilus]|uniref:hypothetical protein n=1 Tax=Thermococcus peptonophilus TaxID=53952 RepID=UPI003467207E
MASRSTLGAWKWYYEVVGGRRCPIIDTWWQTETGGYMIYPPSAGIQLPPLKPGSAAFPGLGVDADVFTSEGKPAKQERGATSSSRSPGQGCSSVSGATMSAT